MVGGSDFIIKDRFSWSEGKEGQIVDYCVLFKIMY